jgi:hypothetical protein
VIYARLRERAAALPTIAVQDILVGSAWTEGDFLPGGIITYRAYSTRVRAQRDGAEQDGGEMTSTILRSGGTIAVSYGTGAMRIRR